MLRVVPMTRRTSDSDFRDCPFWVTNVADVARRRRTLHPSLAVDPGTPRERRRDTPESCRLAAGPRNVEEGHKHASELAIAAPNPPLAVDIVRQFHERPALSVCPYFARRVFLERRLHTSKSEGN